MKIDIDLILEDLKLNKSVRTQNSLEQLNRLLNIRFNENEQDYSISTIARASKALGGIGEVSIRNASGLHYRQLINAWAAKAQTTTKKKYLINSRKNQLPTDIELVRKLDDPVLRAIFGQIIAENRKLKAENSILKNESNIVIDMRPIGQSMNSFKEQNKDESILKNFFLESEIVALRDSINIDKINRRYWSLSESGGINDENGRPIFKSGFIVANQKVLSEL